MTIRFHFPALAIVGLSLSSCGGGSTDVPMMPGGAVAVPAQSNPPSSAAVPTPTPTPVVAPPPLPTPGSVEERLILPDRTFYSKNSYAAYASPWCAFRDTSLVIGVDLIDSISVLRSTFPSATILSALSPNQSPNLHGCGVYGYHFVAFGNYDGTTVSSPVSSRRASEISALSIDFEMTHSGPGEHNVLNEFYLTSAAGDLSSKVIEIGFFLHASTDALSFAGTGTAVGTFTDNGGRDWRVTKVGKFVMLMPASNGDVLSATLDIKPLFALLRERGIITGQEWFNGVAVGIEPVGGKSTMNINRWNVTYH